MQSVENFIREHRDKLIGHTPGEVAAAIYNTMPSAVVVTLLKELSAYYDVENVKTLDPNEEF